MKTIKIPEYFDHAAFNSILDQRDSIEREVAVDAKELIFDVSETKYISVLGLLLITQICDSVSEDCKCKVHYGKPRNKSIMASLMRTMGMVPSNYTEEISKYLDQHRVAVQRCFNGQENLDAVNKVIKIIKNELNPSMDVLKALNWSLWELVDNAGMHGYGVSEFGVNYPKPVYFCAFDYHDIIDIAILDCGKGIQQSFLGSNIVKYKNLTNKEALNLSIQKGESGNPKGSTGFGLFGCSEIARQTQGELVIISGSDKLVVTKNGTDTYSASKFDGVMVSLSMPRGAVINLKNIFGEKGLILDSIGDLFGEYNG